MSYRSSRTATQLQYIDARIGIAYGRGECIKRAWLLKEKALAIGGKFGPFEPQTAKTIRAKRLTMLAKRWDARAKQARMELDARSVHA